MLRSKRPSADHRQRRRWAVAHTAPKLSFKAHPHVLRHACGYALTSKGHDTRALQAYLGHRNIQHTVRYTELSPTPFKDFGGRKGVGASSSSATSGAIAAD
jgi:site-specific recombinase XerD